MSKYEELAAMRSKFQGSKKLSVFIRKLHEAGYIYLPGDPEVVDVEKRRKNLGFFECKDCSDKELVIANLKRGIEGLKVNRDRILDQKKKLEGK